MRPSVNPYYEDAAVTLYHGDAEEVLPELKEPVHLILTDPPYGMEYQSNRRQQQLEKIAGDDGSIDVPALLTLACKSLARGRHAYVFGPIDLSETPLAAQQELIWNKERMGSGDLTAPFGPEHETITFAVYEPSKANREKGYGRLAARVRKGSVLHCPRPNNGSSKVNAAAEKPVPILREMIESSSCIGETVLDLFAGSGSTLLAAVLEGRKAIGIEVSESQCEAAVKRIVPVAELVASIERAA